MLSRRSRLRRRTESAEPIAVLRQPSAAETRRPEKNRRRQINVIWLTRSQTESEYGRLSPLHLVPAGSPPSGAPPGHLYQRAGATERRSERPGPSTPRPQKRTRGLATAGRGQSECGRGVRQASRPNFHGGPTAGGSLLFVAPPEVIAQPTGPADQAHRSNKPIPHFFGRRQLRDPHTHVLA